MKIHTRLAIHLIGLAILVFLIPFVAAEVQEAKATTLVSMSAEPLSNVYFLVGALLGVWVLLVGILLFIMKRIRFP